jgi:hypothetical protein
MSAAKQVRFPSPLSELAELEDQVQVWVREAVLLARSMESIAAALRIDPSQIQLTGDAIVFESRSSALASAIFNLAKLRNVVCNLKLLRAQHEQFQAQSDPFRRQSAEKQIRRAR